MLLGGWFAWNHHRQDSSAALANSSSSDWQKRPAAVTRKIVDHPAPISSLPDTVPLPPPAGASPEPATDAAGEAGVAAAALSVPDAASIESYYRGLFRRLHFTPEQVAAFQNLQEAAFSDLLNTLSPAERERLNNSPAAVRQLMFTSDTGIDARVLQQFGDVVFAQYKQDMQTFPQRLVVDEFDRTLRTAGSELSDEQANQLVQILVHTETPGARTEASGISPDALNAAATVLTPEQFQALQQFQATQP